MGDEAAGVGGGLPESHKSHQMEVFSAALIMTSTGSWRVSDSLPLLVGNGGLSGGVWGARNPVDEWGEGHQQPCPSHPSVGEENVGGRGGEGSVGLAGSREPPPQNAGSCQRLASRQSTRAEDQDGLATDLTICLPCPILQCGAQGQHCAQGTAGDLCPQSLRPDEDEGE